MHHMRFVVTNWPGDQFTGTNDTWGFLCSNLAYLVLLP